MIPLNPRCSLRGCFIVIVKKKKTSLKEKYHNTGDIYETCIVTKHIIMMSVLRRHIAQPCYPVIWDRSCTGTSLYCTGMQRVFASYSNVSVS